VGNEGLPDEYHRSPALWAEYQPMPLFLRVFAIILIAASCGAGDLYQEIRTDDVDLLVVKANQGDAVALTKLGVIAQAGLRGRMVDDEYAVQCFAKAAALNYPDGLQELGFMYAAGRGVTKNLAISFNYYLRAAKLGNSRAMDTVGYFYKSGEGVPRNYVEAYRWSSLAAARNVYGADIRVNELEKLMTPEERMEAQRRALETHEQLTAKPNSDVTNVAKTPDSTQTARDRGLTSLIYHYDVEIVIILLAAALVTIIVVLTPSSKKPAAQKREEKKPPSFLKYWAIVSAACFTLWAFLGWGNAGMEGLGKAIGAGLIMAPISGFIFGGIYWLIKK
jgi:hypothetical protein